MFARVAGVSVLCIAQITNTMGQAEKDFSAASHLSIESRYAIGY
jgi:hypothetical protein